jgi:Tfp pilus assembly protein PilO
MNSRIILVSFILIFGCWFFLKKSLDEYALVQMKGRALEARCLAKHHQFNRLYHAVQSEHDRLKSVLKFFIHQQDLPLILDKLSSLSVQCGLTLDEISPEPERRQTFYTELPIAILAFGRYQDVVEFLTKVSAMRPLITWDNVIMVSPTVDNANTPLAIQLTATLYRHLT